MTLYRVCRILFVTLLVAALGCPPVTNALSIERPVDIHLESAMPADIETPAALRLTIAYCCTASEDVPFAVSLRVAGLELRLQVRRKARNMSPSNSELAGRTPLSTRIGEGFAPVTLSNRQIAPDARRK